jgi:hypothetical protein
MIDPSPMYPDRGWFAGVDAMARPGSGVLPVDEALFEPPGPVAGANEIMLDASGSFDGSARFRTPFRRLLSIRQ